MKLFFSSTLMVLLYLFAGVSLFIAAVAHEFIYFMLGLTLSVSAGVLCNHIYEPRKKN